MKTTVKLHLLENMRLETTLQNAYMLHIFFLAAYFNLFLPFIINVNGKQLRHIESHLNFNFVKVTCFFYEKFYLLLYFQKPEQFSP